MCWTSSEIQRDRRYRKCRSHTSVGSWPPSSPHLSRSRNRPETSRSDSSRHARDDSGTRLRQHKNIGLDLGFDFNYRLLVPLILVAFRSENKSSKLKICFLKSDFENYIKWCNVTDCHVTRLLFTLVVTEAAWARAVLTHPAIVEVTFPAVRPSVAVNHILARVCIYRQHNSDKQLTDKYRGSWWVRR